MVSVIARNEAIQRVETLVCIIFMRRIAAKCSIPVIIVNTVTWTQYNNKISISKLFLLSGENPPLKEAI
jgi:hypothetical protein